MRRTPRSLPLALLLWLAPLAAAPAAAQDFDVVPDVVYGHKDGRAMTFDVLRPRAGANGAAVLYMVSGGWVSTWAPPEQVATRFEALLDRGFTVFVVRHGSSPRYLVPDAVADVRRATRYIRAHAAEWGVDPERLGAYGGSAGGHLSLMLGTASDAGDPAAEEELLRGSNRIASVVAYYPPVDLRSWARGVEDVTPAGGPPMRFPALNFEVEKASDVSPLLFVTPDDAPTLLIHGDQDELVPLSHSERILAALRENRVATDLIVLKGAGHGFQGADAEAATAAMVGWFEKTLVGDR